MRAEDVIAAAWIVTRVVIVKSPADGWTGDSEPVQFRPAILDRAKDSPKPPNMEGWSMRLTGDT